jgi:hypothetical protein
MVQVGSSTVVEALHLAGQTLMATNFTSIAGPGYELMISENGLNNNLT